MAASSAAVWLSRPTFSSMSLPTISFWPSSSASVSLCMICQRSACTARSPIASEAVSLRALTHSGLCMLALTMSASARAMAALALAFILAISASARARSLLSSDFCTACTSARIARSFLSMAYAIASLDCLRSVAICALSLASFSSASAFIAVFSACSEASSC